MVDATTNSAPPPPLARYGGMHILVYMYMYVLLSDDYIHGMATCFKHLQKMIINMSLNHMFIKNTKH